MAKVMGIINIGQSPRPDGLIVEMAQVLGSGFEVLEAGALDGLSREEIEEKMAPGPTDYLLISLLRDGAPVRFAKRHILPLLQQRIDELNDRGVDMISLTCAGTFPKFRSRKPVLLPQPALYGLAKGIVGKGKVGAMTPLPEQVPLRRAAWEEAGVNAVCVHADPYGDPAQLERAAAELVAEQVDLVFMGCFGYDLAMKEKVRRLTGKPVLLSRSALARILGELA